MDIETVERRLSDLQAGRDQMLANLYLQDGAIKDCEFWLAELKATTRGLETAPREEKKNGE